MNLKCWYYNFVVVLANVSIFMTVQIQYIVIIT